MSRARRGRLGLSPADIFGTPAEVTPPKKKATKPGKPAETRKAAVPRARAKAAPKPEVVVTSPPAVVVSPTSATLDTAKPDSHVWRAGYLLGLTLARVLGALRRLRRWPRQRKG